MKSGICQLNRQSPRGRFGWLCVTNNGDCSCDDLGEEGGRVGALARRLAGNRFRRHPGVIADQFGHVRRGWASGRSAEDQGRTPLLIHVRKETLGLIVWTTNGGP
jgi:hypothetical protein